MNQQNRQMRQMAQKQGADQPKRARAQAARAGAAPPSAPARRQFFMEVRGELRKVAWPTRQEVINSTIIVLIAVVVMTTLIFGADYAFAKGVLFLYD